MVKNAIGGDDDFEFYSDKLGGFTLTTMGGTDSTTFTDLIPGPYAVAESDLPAGWDLTDATCDDGSTPNAITLDAGETVTCTFENTKRGQIDVVKQTLGDDGTFEFTSSTLPSLTIETTGGTTVTTGIGTASYPLLTPGTYDLQETAQTGWDLTSATCDNGTPGAIVVASGETTTCTFENSKRATLIVSKLTDPKASDEAFVFNVNGGPDGIDETFSLKDAESQDIVNLQPGTGYSVIETLPADWDLQDATCSDGSAPAAIQLDPGETVECTFTNMDPTVPVTLGWFLAERNGDRVDFRWQTATETGTAGFNILALTESEAVQLNEALIPSTVIDSVEPTDYAFSAVTDATSFLLQEVEITGALNLRGPFMIGVESGVYSGVNAKDSYQIWLPLMMR